MASGYEKSPDYGGPQGPWIAAGAIALFIAAFVVAWWLVRHG
jgi:hypothetical protein